MFLTSDSRRAITTISNLMGTNANFIRVQSQGLIDIRTYERGVEGETLACGTGFDCFRDRRSVSLGKVVSPVSVKTASGVVLKIHFSVENGEAKNVYLEGDARVIYVGELTSDAWDY